MAPLLLFAILCAQWFLESSPLLSAVHMVAAIRMGHNEAKNEIAASVHTCCISLQAMVVKIAVKRSGLCSPCTCTSIFGLSSSILIPPFLISFPLPWLSFYPSQASISIRLVFVLCVVPVFLADTVNSTLSVYLFCIHQSCVMLWWTTWFPFFVVARLKPQHVSIANPQKMGSAMKSIFPH